jgi:hypothetical protein
LPRTSLKIYRRSCKLFSPREFCRLMAAKT